MDVKEYLKQLAKTDPAKFFSVIGYYILKKAVEDDKEAQKLVNAIKTMTNVDINEILDTALKESIKTKPNLIHLGLGSIMLVSYIMNRNKGKGGNKHG